MLTDRLAGNLLYRIGRDILVTSSLQLAHLAFSSPAQVVDLATGQQATPPALSPQDRTIYLLMAAAAVDWAVPGWGPVSLFAQADYQGLDIRADRVNDTSIGGGGMRKLLVDAYPNRGGYEATSRITLIVGVRLFTRPLPRDADVLLNARALP